ncbi:Rib/alpha-like domain-containing protein [Anaerococcus vaginalis]|uniref:Rib/alpha-like domain-containing protein n=1 Tax=Anaerococcus vaginalis TaxID=33037 RepID=UPI001E57EE1D|nr:Rib/alpha-like domain-containing protein [Anaerococcus vaginalis]
MKLEEEQKAEDEKEKELREKIKEIDEKIKGLDLEIKNLKAEIIKKQQMLAALEQKPIADTIDPILPKDRVKVKNLEKLTEKEKEEIKNKIKDLNKNNFPENTQVEVDEKGNVSVTYPDKSKDMIESGKLVFQESKGAATEIEKPEMPISEIINPLLPKNKIKVNNLEKLTEKEKEEIKNKIKDINKNNFPKNTQVEVDEKGNVTITYPDNSKDTINASDLVEKMAQAQNNKTDAQNNPAVIPAKTLVKDKNNLTDKEKAEIASKVKKSNPKAINIEVTKNGSVTITYPDGSKNMIDGSKLVSEKAKEITSNSKKAKLTPANNKSKNVKTGVGSSASILTILAGSVGGLFVSKKRKK